MSDRGTSSLRLVKLNTTQEYAVEVLRADVSLEIDLINQSRVPDRVASLGRHPNEAGWNLPVTHKHHILQFPPDMLFCRP